MNKTKTKNSLKNQYHVKQPNMKITYFVGKMATLALAYDPEDPKQPVMFSRRAHSDGATRDTTNNKDKSRKLGRGRLLETKTQPEKLGRAEGTRSLAGNNPRPPELLIRASAAEDPTPFNPNSLCQVHSGGNNAGNCDECNLPLFCQSVRCNCEGNGGGGQQDPGGCWCDTASVENSDCSCADCAADHCDDDDRPIYVLTSEGIGQAPAGGCWCDSYSEIAKDGCCSCEFCNVDS